MKYEPAYDIAKLLKHMKTNGGTKEQAEEMLSQSLDGVWERITPKNQTLKG